MILGVSQVDITPKPGVELSGFAARVQPSIGVLDALFAKALYFEDDRARLLWLHCDLIGFDRSTVHAFRDWAAKELGLPAHQVMLSATHTHAGPCTIHLREAGEFDPVYVDLLLERLRAAAREAVATPSSCELVVAEGRLNLAVDRRKRASAHTDPRVGALGFRRRDGSFAAVVVNYAIHPVALGSANRLISADLSGQAALALSPQLPGRPVVLATNGACANLNPPAENVTAQQVRIWGDQIAKAVGGLARAGQGMAEPRLAVASRVVHLPLDVLDAKGIHESADRALRNAEPLAQWGDKYRRVVEYWRETLLKNHHQTANGRHEAELFGIRLADIILVGANAEVFSEFTDMLRKESARNIYLVGYANGDVGYLPTRAAYLEGGYEVEVAHMFYGGFRPKAGGLELLASAATELISNL